MSRTDKIIKKIKIMLFGVSCPYRACAFCKEPGKKCDFEKLEEVDPNGNCDHFVDETE